jgi:hypothetical protein
MKIWLSALAFCLLCSSSTSCDVCGDPDVEITRPGKTIAIPGYEIVDSCGTLVSLSSLLADDSDECLLIQSLGTLCGCPIPNGACTLCPDGSSAPNANFETDYPLLGGYSPTCDSCRGTHALTYGKQHHV